MGLRLYGIVLASQLFAASAPRADAQDRSSFTNPRRAQRLTTTRSALDAMERDTRSLRKAIVDTALGTHYVHEVSSSASAQRWLSCESSRRATSDVSHTSA